ncbi:hypothetical protein [Nocardioides gilvus]|uniref:hypothetical protein n=1 Tax=Nocardioides gilvus TaxID=1735589 RepID=UPI000D74D77B|nr:hypothetical protein [Nocardioides gilvus]
MRHFSNMPLAMAALLCALLTGCGTDDGSDGTQWGTGEVVGSGPTSSSDTSEGSASGGASSRSEVGDSTADSNDTVPMSDLSDEQVTLHGEMILFEETAKAKAGDGSGGSAGSLRDPGEASRSGVARPEGVSLAQDYAISWMDGKVVSYALTTASGERMTYEAGRISLDVAVESPRHAELKKSAEALARAVDDWVEANGEVPSVSHSIQGFTLSDGFFSESEVEEIEVPFEGDIAMPEYSRTNDDFTVTLRSDDTQERARLTQDGLTFSRPYEVV